MIALLKYTRKALKDEHYKLSLQSVFVAYQQKIYSITFSDYSGVPVRARLVAQIPDHLLIILQ